MSTIYSSKYSYCAKFCAVFSWKYLKSIDVLVTKCKDYSIFVKWKLLPLKRFCKLRKNLAFKICLIAQKGCACQAVPLMYGLDPSRSHFSWKILSTIISCTTDNMSFLGIIILILPMWSYWSYLPKAVMCGLYMD